MNKPDIFESEVNPLCDKICELCKRHGVRLVLAASLGDSEREIVLGSKDTMPETHWIAAQIIKLEVKG